ncbi:MAG: integrin [Gammaproteobacteria bacterium]|nr:MAG: integrin [Gammaproteobacteria bacterium]
MEMRALMKNKAALVLLTVSLSGCGGGGGGDPQPAQQKPDAPELSLQMQAIKTFRLTWNDVQGETEYRLFEDPDGTSGFGLVATLDAGTTAYEHEVFLPARQQARYMLQACNEVGCSDSPEIGVNGDLTGAIGYLKATQPEAYARFGGAVSVSEAGDTLAVGAWGESSAEGRVHIFVRSAAGWSHQATLSASNADPSDWFGTRLALSGDGNTLAVSATLEDSAATGINGDQSDNTADRAGAVYVFQRTGTTWTQEAYVKAADSDPLDFFGAALSLSYDGNILAVGMTGDDSSATGINGDATNDDRIDPGAVYVFTRDSGDWAQQAYIKPAQLQTGPFGSSLALDKAGETLVVGSYGDTLNTSGGALVGGAGQVYVFRRDGVTWSQSAVLTASNPDDSDWFGWRVALSGDGRTLAAAARFEHSAATGVGGDGNDNSASNSGAVYAFIRQDDGTWVQEAYVKASNTDADDEFGHSVALDTDGNTLVVGTSREDSAASGLGGDQSDNSAPDAGAVYVFRRSQGSWSQLAYVKAAAPDENDGFGLGGGVGINGAGDMLVVGATGESGAGPGLEGDPEDNSLTKSGAVFVY